MHLNGFIETLPVVFYGMAGIFIVMGIICLAIVLLQKFTK